MWTIYCMSRVLLFYFHWKFNSKLDAKGNPNTTAYVGINVWMEGVGEGRCWWVKGIGLAFQVFSNFFFQFPDLRLEISSNLIESLFTGNKTTVWAKICGQNPQRGNKASVQISHLHIYAHISFPRLNVDIYITNTTWKQAKEHLKWI